VRGYTVLLIMVLLLLLAPRRDGSGCLRSTLRSHEESAGTVYGDGLLQDHQVTARNQPTRAAEDQSCVNMDRAIYFPYGIRDVVHASSLLYDWSLTGFGLPLLDNMRHISGGCTNALFDGWDCLNGEPYVRHARGASFSIYVISNQMANASRWNGAYAQDSETRVRQLRPLTAFGSGSNKTAREVVHPSLRPHPHSRAEHTHRTEDWWASPHSSSIITSRSDIVAARFTPPA
jgi:hypothetical protein